MIHTLLFHIRTQFLNIKKNERAQMRNNKQFKIHVTSILVYELYETKLIFNNENITHTF